MIQFDELTKEDLINIRIECDKSLMFFTRFWFKVLKNQKFIVAPHHEKICKSLERVEKYEIEHLNINIPPRCSKTELAGVNFIARGIGMNPSANYLYITASDELRSLTSVAIRDIVSHPYFYIMYGVQLKKDQNGKNLWRTNKGGGLKTATVLGQITGFGAGQMIEQDTELEDYIRTFEGCIVLDDINKIDDTGQENANNEKVNRTVFNTVLSRKNSSDTPIINIQQRAGENDITAKFMEYYKDNPKSEFLVMPIISTDGVLLWEWKYGLDKIEELKNSELTKNIFETQYMQNPVDEKTILVPFTSLKWMVKATPEQVVKRLCIVDPADEGADSYSAIFIDVCFEENEFFVNVNDVVHTTDSLASAVPLTVEKLSQYAIEEIYIEKNGLGVAVGYELKHHKVKASINPYHEQMNKEQKINSYYDFVKKYFRFNKELYDTDINYKTFINHLTKYSQKGTNKNIKDALDVCCAGAKVLKVKYNSLIYKNN